MPVTVCGRGRSGRRKATVTYAYFRFQYRAGQSLPRYRQGSKAHLRWGRFYVSLVVDFAVSILRISAGFSPTIIDGLFAGSLRHEYFIHLAPIHGLKSSLWEFLNTEGQYTFILIVLLAGLLNIKLYF